MVVGYSIVLPVAVVVKCWNAHSDGATPIQVLWWTVMIVALLHMVSLLVYIRVGKNRPSLFVFAALSMAEGIVCTITLLQPDAQFTRTLLANYMPLFVLTTFYGAVFLIGTMTAGVLCLVGLCAWTLND